MNIPVISIFLMKRRDTAGQKAHFTFEFRDAKYKCKKGLKTCSID